MKKRSTSMKVLGKGLNNNNTFGCLNFSFSPEKKTDQTYYLTSTMPQGICKFTSRPCFIKDQLWWYMSDYCGNDFQAADGQLYKACGCYYC
jgi:hypothetical protein